MSYSIVQRLERGSSSSLLGGGWASDSAPKREAVSGERGESLRGEGAVGNCGIFRSWKMWEFPKIEDPHIVPQIVGSLL